MEIVKDLKQWPGKLMKNHKDSNHPIHKLAFLADIGVQVNDSDDISYIIEKIKENKSDENVFQVLINIPKHFGGTGENQLSWIICDAPTILYSMAKMGMKNDEAVIMGAKYLANLVNKNGWRCSSSKELGKFRGPGKKDDACPYANLLMLKLLSELDKNEFSNEIELGTESLLKLWEERKIRKEYLFGMGTDFQKLKAPLVWLDLLHVLDVLSRYKFIYKDKQFLEMLTILKEKVDKNLELTPESVYINHGKNEFWSKKITIKMDYIFSI